MKLAGAGEVETVLTVPAGLEIPAGLAGWRSIADLIRTLIASTQERVWLLNPFLDEAGMEHFLEPATTALRRGVRFTVITQHLQQGNKVWGQVIFETLIPVEFFKVPKVSTYFSP